MGCPPLVFGAPDDSRPSTNRADCRIIQHSRLYQEGIHITFPAAVANSRGKTEHDKYITMHHILNHPIGRIYRLHTENGILSTLLK